MGSAAIVGYPEKAGRKLNADNEKNSVHPKLVSNCDGGGRGRRR
jgi:hypothetical protein